MKKAVGATIAVLFALFDASASLNPFDLNKNLKKIEQNQAAILDELKMQEDTPHTIELQEETVEPQEAIETILTELSITDENKSSKQDQKTATENQPKTPKAVKGHTPVKSHPKRTPKAPHKTKRHRKRTKHKIQEKPTKSPKIRKKIEKTDPPNIHPSKAINHTAKKPNASSSQSQKTKNKKQKTEKPLKPNTSELKKIETDNVTHKISSNSSNSLVGLFFRDKNINKKEAEETIKRIITKIEQEE